MTLELEQSAGDPVMGIDEAGRGPLAGPVFAAAVHLPVAVAERLAAERDASSSEPSPDSYDTHHDMLSSGFVHV